MASRSKSEAAKKAWETMRAKGIIRRRWWELDPVVEQYVKEMHQTWRRISSRDPEMARSILKLPNDFTCYHSSKGVPIEERIHRIIVLALHRPKGALEYDMLEADRILLRRVKRWSR